MYGEHEQGGDWDDDGEWHLVNDGDLDSSDEDEDASVHSSDVSGDLLGDGPEDYSSFSDDSESLHSSEFDTSDDGWDSDSDADNAGSTSDSDSDADSEGSTSESEGGEEQMVLDEQ